MNYIVYLLNNTITAIAPDTLDPQAEGYVYDETDDYMPGLAIGDRRVGPGQYERPVPVLVTPVTELLPIDFQRRFTPAEYFAAKQYAESDALMAYVFGLFDKAPMVHLNHPDTQAGVGYMQYVGIVTAERAAAILSGGAP